MDVNMYALFMLSKAPHTKAKIKKVYKKHTKNIQRQLKYNDIIKKDANTITVTNYNKKRRSPPQFPRSHIHCHHC